MPLNTSILKKTELNDNSINPPLVEAPQKKTSVFVTAVNTLLPLDFFVFFFL